MTNQTISDNARLKHDSIVEALVEIRFDHSEIFEIVTGKLAGLSPRTVERFERLPLADFPAPVRRADPNLSVQPLLQAVAENGRRLLKVGEQVLSYHALEPYPGWQTLSTEIGELNEKLFRDIQGVTIKRIGLRYVNLLRSQVHNVNDMSSTNVRVTVAGSELTEKLNVNYQRHLSDHIVLVRVATPEFVEGPAQGFSMMIDVDIFTPSSFHATSAAEAVAWIENAHIQLKKEFFGLIRPEVLKELVEE